MKNEKGKLTAADMDLRVRDRHLAAGVLEPKVVERYLADLVDVESNCDTVPFDQPAVGVRGHGL